MSAHKPNHNNDDDTIWTVQEIAERLIKHRMEIINWLSMKYMKDRDVAEDLYSSTMETVLRKAREGKISKEEHSEKALHRYFRTTAYRKFIDHYRKHSKNPHVSKDDDDVFLDQVLKVEDKETLSARMAQTKPVTDLFSDPEFWGDTQQIVRPEQYSTAYRHLALGEKFGEIAQEDEVSINTSIQRMRYFRQALKKNDIFLKKYSERYGRFWAKADQQLEAFFNRPNKYEKRSFKLASTFTKNGVGSMPLTAMNRPPSPIQELNSWYETQGEEAKHEIARQTGAPSQMDL